MVLAIRLGEAAAIYLPQELVRGCSLSDGYRKWYVYTDSKRKAMDNRLGNITSLTNEEKVHTGSFVKRTLQMCCGKISSAFAKADY